MGTSFWFPAVKIFPSSNPLMVVMLMSVDDLYGSVYVSISGKHHVISCHRIENQEGHIPVPGHVTMLGDPMVEEIQIRHHGQRSPRSFWMADERYFEVMEILFNSLTLTKLEVNLCLICLGSIYNKYGGFEPSVGCGPTGPSQVAILPMNLEAATNPSKFQTMTAYYNPFISKRLLPRPVRKHCPRIEKPRYITRSLLCFRMNHQYGNILLK